MSLSDFMKDKNLLKEQNKEIKENITQSQSNQQSNNEEDRNSKPIVILSQIDAYINDRLKEQPRSLSDVKVKDVELGDNRHALSLPEPIEKLLKSKKLTGRWINKDKRMLDRALDTRGWTIFNRLYFPDLAKHYFTANGTVERGDSILCFMPEAAAKRLRLEPGQKSLERVSNLPVEKWKDGGEKYYKPALTEEKDGQEFTSGIQPDRILQEN